MTFEQRIAQDGAEAFREDFAEGFARYLEMAEDMVRRREARQAEERRVAALIRHDRIAREKEEKRKLAQAEVEKGRYVRLNEARDGPTREQRQRAEYVPAAVQIAGAGTVRTVETVRNATANRVLQLYRREVLDRDQARACDWFHRRWAMSGLGLMTAARWSEIPRGDRLYGHMARSEAQIEARADYRWAREFVPEDVRALFELVILNELAVAEAARMSRCRYANAAAALRRGALALLGGVAHRVTIAAEDW